jgi:hypothetical protein
MIKDVRVLCLPDKAVSHVPDQILGSVLQYLGEGHSKDEMMAVGVRRGKAALSSGCKSHPATAPAGSNRSSHGGNEVAEASG